MLTKLKNKKLLILIDQMLVSGSNFVLGILLARYLGVEGYGQFALLWLIVLFFSSLQLAYIVSPMLTLGSKKSSFILDRYLSTMIFLQVIFTAVAIISLYFFLEVAVFFDEKWDMGDLKIYILFTTLFFLFQDFLRRYFIIKTQYYKLVFIDVIAYLGQLGMLIYFIYNNSLDLSTALLAVAIPFLLALLVGYTQVTKVSTHMQYKKLIFLKNWNFSRWLVYSAVIQWGSGNFFILAGGAILGSWAVGVIRVMQNTMGIFQVLFTVLDNILPINFSKIYKQDGYNGMMKYYNKHFKFGLVIFSLLSSVVYLFATELVTFVYGDEYTKYAYLLIGFVVLIPIVYTTMLQRYVLRTVEETKVIFTAYVSTTVFSLLSAYPLIKYFRIDGILIGMFIVQIIISFLFYRTIISMKQDLCVKLYDAKEYELSK